jgi:hypothetical protein
LTLKKKETKNEKHGVNDDVKNCSQKHRLLVVCSTKKKKPPVIKRGWKTSQQFDGFSQL